MSEENNVTEEVEKNEGNGIWDNDEDENDKKAKKEKNIRISQIEEKINQIKSRIRQLNK